MKQFSLLVILSLLFAATTQAQEIKPDTSHGIKTYAYYMKKRNTYNAIAWTCLGSGSLLVLTGLVTTIGDSFNHRHKSNGEAIAVTGELLALASVPLFIIAHHNKKMARLYVSKSSAIINDRPFYKTNCMSVTLAFKL